MLPPHVNTLDEQITRRFRAVRRFETNLERYLFPARIARRQRILLSQSPVSRVKWIGLLLLGLCALVAIAMADSDNRTTSAIALALFATGIALSILMIGCYSRPFTAEVSI